MDFLTSLPADLVALADPSVRGPAPLLRPPDSDGALATPTPPFSLDLAPAAELPPGGETWPAAGKQLPVVPLELAAEPAERVAADALLAVAPPTLGVAALQVRAVPVGAALGAAAEAIPAKAVPKPAATPAAILPPPSATPAPAVEPLATPSADLDPLAALAGLAAPESEPAPLATGAEPVAAGGTTKSTPPSWLETLAELRTQRPLVLAPSDARAAEAPLPPAASGAAGAAQSQLTAAAAAPGAEMPIVVRRLDLPKPAVSAVTVTDSASVGQAEWGMPAAAPGAAPTALPPPVPPAVPVDLRSPNWHDAFANRVQWLVDNAVGEARIKLNPPELGAVDVTISLVEDKTYVQLTTATAAARDELSQSLPRLRELFAGSGLELGGASVHNGRDGQASAHGYGAGAAEPCGLTSFAEPGDERAAVAPRRSGGRIDVFA